MGDESRQCKGITRTSRRCRRSAKAGSDFCGLHDGRGKAPGAPLGNQNAFKHGLYSELFTPDEFEALARFGAAEGLADEIALLRAKIYSAVKKGGAELDAIGRACGRLTQMLKAQRLLTGKSANEFERTLDEVLASVTLELDLKL